VKPTKEQKDFIRAKDNHILTLASAGSGKTFSIVNFIVDKLKNGVESNEIIAFSFTKKASNELKDRILKSVKKGEELRYISTIHSFCWNYFIIPYYKHIGYTSLPVITHQYPEDYIKKICEFNDIDTSNKEYKSTKKYLEMMDKLSKDLNSRSFSLMETIFLDKFLKKKNIIMFDFMTHYANEILLEHKELVEDLLKNIKYIIVDEAQDVNPSQYKFIELLHNVIKDFGGNVNIVKVGDIKQCIYAFRGSDPMLLKEFINDFNPSVYYLSSNFRSGDKIVDNANKFVSNYIDLKDKKLNKSLIQVAHNKGGIVKKIEKNFDFLRAVLSCEKPLHNNCILTRSNKMAVNVAKVLKELKVPYYLHSEYEMLKRVEIKLLINFIKISNSFNMFLMKDIIKAIKKSIPSKLEKIIEELEDCNNIDFFIKKTLKYKGIKEIYQLYNLFRLNDFDKAFNLIGELLKTKEKKKEYIIENLNIFLDELEKIKRENDLGTFNNTIDYLMFQMEENDKNYKDKIQIMTIHKAKGLEWDKVILIYSEFFYDKIFMNEYALSKLTDEELKMIEEEKRVWYTAITRPKNELILWIIDSKEWLFSQKYMKSTIEKFNFFRHRNPNCL